MAAVWKLVALAFGCYGVLCLLVVVFQRSLMYFPSRATEADAKRTARSLGLESWQDARGGLLGWRLPKPPPGLQAPGNRAPGNRAPGLQAPGNRAPGLRVLVFHGNAGSALDRTYYHLLLGGAGTEVILFEYPGYGPRSGEPSQDRLVEAGERALVSLRQEAPGPVWLLGESLGSGVACAVAARRSADVAGLFLVTPFARMTDVAAWHYPYLPVRLLLRDRWDSLAALAGYPGPVGLFIAGRDEVVGASQGHALASSLGGRARYWEQPDAGHNDFTTRPDAYPWPEVRAFLANPAARGE
jgi:uncharacterized protein